MQSLWTRWVTPRRLRHWREYLTGYLMIAPATFLIFLFGIFPVGFALFVSMHKWRLKRGNFIGLDNYLKAIGNLTYLAGFVLGVGALFGAFWLFRRWWREAREHTAHFWLTIVPGLAWGGFILAMVRWSVVVLPHILDIADKIRGLEKTRALFRQLLHEAFTMPDVLAARSLAFALLGAGLLLSALSLWRWNALENLQMQAGQATAWVTAGVGLVLLRFTYSEMMRAYAAAIEQGSDPGILPQLLSISSGLILLFLGWKVWRSAEERLSTGGFFFQLFGALVLLVGGWILIGELPVVVAAGDPDLWRGLKVTIYYSLGTIPFQLSISLVLAILLFRNLRGSAFFRIMYFMPYITPTVASAAVFRQLFSNRPQAPANALLRLMGLEPLGWLWEPRGVFAMAADALGWANFPEWAAGPSLALVVIMTFSIWVFVGYDTVIYMAGLGNIPTEVNEAAEVDGANSWQIFRYITFPLLSPTTYFLSLIAVIGTFKAFNHIWVMRLPASLNTADTFSVVIFIEFFEKLRYGYASAMAFVLFAIILSLTYINNKVQGSKVFYG